MKRVTAKRRSCGNIYRIVAETMNKIIVNGKCICRRTISLHSFQYQMTWAWDDKRAYSQMKAKLTECATSGDEKWHSNNITTSKSAARFQNMWTSTTWKRKINYWHMSRMNLLRMAFYTRKNSNKKQTVMIVIANDMREIHTRFDILSQRWQRRRRILCYMKRKAYTQYSIELKIISPFHPISSSFMSSVCGFCVQRSRTTHTPGSMEQPESTNMNFTKAIFILHFFFSIS